MNLSSIADLLAWRKNGGFDQTTLDLQFRDLQYYDAAPDLPESNATPGFISKRLSVARSSWSLSVNHRK